MNQIRLNKIYALCCLMMCLLRIDATAQDETVVTVTGQVQDQWGKPVVGAIITSANGKNGSSTAYDGQYTIDITDESDALLISATYYKTQRIAIGDSRKVDAVLEDDIHGTDEQVELGYSVIRRGALSGSVASVDGSVLERSPVANLRMSFAGRFPGLITQEATSELSRANTSLYVRGVSAARGSSPLAMIDGIITSYNANQTLEYISANEIESISILKDAASQAMYGTLGANGIIVIKTKRGRKGPLNVSATLDHAVQQMTTRPTFIGSAEYAALRNQAAANNGLSPFFTEEDIAHFRSGDSPELYPSNDWYRYFMKDLSNMQRVGVNVTGGNDRITFYSNANFMRQGGIYNTDQPEYKTDPVNLWVNYRSNVDMKLNDYLSAFVRLAGNVKRERTPGSSVADVYGSIFELPPTMYGPFTPTVIDPETGQPTPSSDQVLTTQLIGEPTYGRLNRSGYRNHTVTNITSQFGLNADLGFFTKGLTLTGLFAYQTNSVGSLNTLQDYERWQRRSENTTELEFFRKTENTNSPLAYSKGHSHYYHLTYNGVLSYQRTFGVHEVSGTAYAYFQNLTKANTNSPDLLPYNRLSTGIDANYGYDNRYFVRAVLGYSGSEQYAPHKRYTATPAFSAAWAISNEGFLAGNNVVTNLRLRAAWGKTANDQSGLARYSYLDDIEAAAGGSIPYLQYLILEHGFGNPDLAAEIATKTNLGLDVGLFNAFSLSVDVFKEKMENMVIDAANTIPSYQGIPLNSYPSINGGVFENQGYEVALDYQKALNQHTRFTLGGMLSYNDSEVVFVDEAIRTEDYAYRYRSQGFAYGQAFGYLVDYSNGNGYFNTQTELDNNTVEYNIDPRLGDLKFIDLNGDGLLDDKDQAPLGSGAIPQYIYSFYGGLTYKGFDVNVLFQGLGGYSRFMSGIGVWENDLDGIFTSLHQQAWTPERYENGEEITYPALSTGASSSHVNSSFNVYDRSYLRLKNVDLGYTLTGNAAGALGAHKIRVHLSGQNLLTWDHMKTADFGPEGEGFRAIPVYRVYNVGVNLFF
ncbi:SusC/RagA family TonB-linked outer membrane protein [Parapedobacter sp. DT-150]|uniref:SusC/RagA family TonB-linked outer membrane protein n=1 Tax=Parapedobacter sp. DT-150 TaxID=3396162 RepID=UPI003F1AD5C4